ncbi:MAG TPA: DUF4974 domain-containing protein [Phycisphaerae bacterium]|nr:DUF4974 domain-containing protein [Phycisphaerae bacterium]
MKTAAKMGVLLFIFSAVAMAQTGSPPPTDAGGVELALDRKLEKISVSDKPVPEALAEIGAAAHVGIAIDAEAAELLPWGRQTKVADLTIETGFTLRAALPQLLNPLGMTYKVADNHILVVASPPLKRINRRATWEDLKLLRWCQETPYTPEAFAEMKIQYRLTAKIDAPKMLERQLDRAGHGTIAQMLETACNSLGWVWLPDNDEIVIRTHEAQIANMLSRRISVRYTNAPLSKILNDLADRADVLVFFEPGIMLKLPHATAQSYTLLLDQSSIRQALELIAAETGLKYEIRRDGIYIGLSEALAGPTTTAPAAPTRRSPYVARITVPSKDGTFSLDFLLTADELPPDVLEYREQLVDQYVDKMRSELEGALEKSIDKKAQRSASTQPAETPGPTAGR